MVALARIIKLSVVCNLLLYQIEDSHRNDGFILALYAILMVHSLGSSSGLNGVARGDPIRSSAVSAPRSFGKNK